MLDHVKLDLIMPKLVILTLIIHDNRGEYLLVTRRIRSTIPTIFWKNEVVTPIRAVKYMI